MNLSVILGFLTGFGLVAYGMITGSDGVSQVMANFINLPSICITFGGAISATIISVPTKDLKNIPKYIKVLLRTEKININQYIDTLVDLSTEARTNGLLALENKVNNIRIQDDFFRLCIALVVDSRNQNTVKEQIENEMGNIEARHAAAWNVFDTCGSFGPAFGMLGTLIGLINMLANLDVAAGGANSIGRGMAVAIITTFYGSVLVNMICAPISNRLKSKHEDEMMVKDLIKQGALLIQAEENPNLVREQLEAYLSYADRRVGGHIVEPEFSRSSRKNKIKGVSYTSNYR